MLQNRFVLVIDDAPAQGALTASGCRGLGFQSDHVADLRNLQSILMHIRPAAVITQMKLPQDDGLDVMQAVAAVDRGIHILVTGLDVEKSSMVIRAVQHLYHLRHVCVLPNPIWGAGLATFLDGVVRSGAWPDLTAADGSTPWPHPALTVRPVARPSREVAKA